MCNSRLWRSGSAVVLALALVAAGTAGAQAVDEATVERARAIWTEALTNYDAGNYEQALAGFREVYELTNKAAALLNMAQCYYYLMDPVNAMTYFQRALRAMGADIDEDTAADIADKMRRLEDKVARLVIDVNVDGATVEVDGQRVGRSPILDPVYVLPGTVVVRASLRSGVSAEERVVADRGREVRVRLTLAAPGEAPGPGPGAGPGPEAGPGEGAGEGPGPEAGPGEGAGEGMAPPAGPGEGPGEGPVEPLPPPPAATGPGRLVVRCDVEGATVTVNGEAAGRAPIDEERADGFYEVEVAADGYEPYVETVRVFPDQQTTLDVRLAAVSEGLDPLWFWVGVGTTAAFAAATIGLGAAAADYNADAESYLDQMRNLTTSGINNCGANPADNRACWEPFEARIEVLKDRHAEANGTADGLEIGTWVMLGLTAAATGGTVWLFLESAPLFGGSDADITVAPIPTAGGIGLGAWGTF